MVILLRTTAQYCFVRQSKQKGLRSTSYFKQTKSASRYLFVQQSRQKVLYLALLRTRERKNTSRYFLVLFRTRNQVIRSTKQRKYFLLRAATHLMSHLAALTLVATPRALQKRRTKQLPFIAGSNYFLHLFAKTKTQRFSGIPSSSKHVQHSCSHATNILHIFMYWLHDVISDIVI